MSPANENAKKVKPEEYPAEVKRCIDEMKQQREQVFSDLVRLQQEKCKLQNDIRYLTGESFKLSQEQAKKTQFNVELDKMTNETEKAYQR